MITRFYRITITLCLMLMASIVHSQHQLQIEIDGNNQLQQIDGIGVNANTRSWNGNDLKPALSLLLDSMKANIWRVIIETVDGWEEANDNGDPFVFNWKYYDSLYETPKFRKAWSMIEYLNSRSITNNLMINFMGFAPRWMGNKIIEPKYEDEYVEMIGSFFYYAIKNKRLKFGLIAPTNESDHHKFSEGPHLTGEQHTRILRKLIDRMDKWGITGDIKIVAPDNADKAKSFDEFLPAMMKDSVVMSRIAHLGFHSYSGNMQDVQPFISSSAYPAKTHWITEWNEWCNGCDDGILGDYTFNFAKKSVRNLLKLLKTGARACLLWEAYDSYYSHHAPSRFSYWGVLGFDSANNNYFPRKHFYALQQVTRFVQPGSRLLSMTKNIDSIEVLAFMDSSERRVTITGINNSNTSLSLKCILKNIDASGSATLYYTNENENLKSAHVNIRTGIVDVSVPADCIFTLTIKLKPFAGIRPEPKGWYAGDIHVHRNCGDDVIHAEEDMVKMMETNDLAVMSLLADMGNAEVKDSKIDLRKVNGKDISPAPGRVMRWDTEWHWDATYSQFSNQALGGHLVLLGLNKAEQKWEESPYKILEWAKKQNAVSGFAHFQYLNDSVQTELNCCIPVDYPVEAALGTIDFVSEDVFSTTLNSDYFNSEAVVNAYYKLLNCGFRLGLAAGTDFPCNGNEPPGSMLTYAKVDGELTYRKWIDAIKKGKTVVSRNAHKEFLDLKLNGKFISGDEVKSKTPLTVDIDATWTSSERIEGKVELVHNGNVISSQNATAAPGSPYTFKTRWKINESGWICARTIGKNGHQSHTAPIYVTVNNKPVRASGADADFFVSWIDNILKKIATGGAWSKFFTKDRNQVIERYGRARDIYKKISEESVTAPVLVLKSKHGFGNYATEILRAEGLNTFDAKDAGSGNISPKALSKRKVVVIAAENLSDKQAAVLSEYVKNGGKIISLMPLKKLSNVFGVLEKHNGNNFKYLTVNGESLLTNNITSKPMRIHSKSHHYQLNGAQALANFTEEGNTSPAIVLNQYGKGQSISFLYNLPLNIVLTRQGNPDDADKEMDDIPGLRAMDLFTNGWVDTSCNTLNHADEQMRILTRAIRYMSNSQPLPKIWYFPDTLSCLVTLNNDGEDSKESEFEPQFNDVYAKGAKMTLYIKEADLVSKEWTDKWRSRGFEMSGHPDQTAHAANPGWERMDSIFRTLNARLKKTLNIPPMETVTNHWFVWPGKYADGRKDFAAQAKLEELHGIGLDCNYAHYDNNAGEKRFLGTPGYTQGNYTGSGLPMKFSDINGNILNVYQQLNNVYDQQYMEHDDKEGYFNAFKGIMDRSLEHGVYSYISIRAHNNEYFFSKVPLMKMLDYANNKNVPVWTQKQLLYFLKSRDAAEFKNISFQNNALSFTLHAPVSGEAKITCLLPYQFANRSIHDVEVNGDKSTYIPRSVKGEQYVMVPVMPGASYQFNVTYK